MQGMFYGRRRELSLLNELVGRNIASLVVIMGRRRIGKTRLIEEFGRSLNTLSFTGLPPEEGVTAQIEREHFVRQLERQLPVRGLKADDWDDIFWNLAQHTKEGQVLLVFDEINWMGTKDSAFFGKLKTAWDTFFKKNPKLILILSGSVTGWIEKNILKSTGFFGRITTDLKLEELPLHECQLFWGKNYRQISPYEKFKLLCVTGGIPRYLEEIDPQLSSEENIRKLCFRREGYLFGEYDRICTELFAKRGPTYQKILELLAKKTASLEEIYQTLEIQKSGTVSEYLEDLEKIGYIARDHTWRIKEGVLSPLSHYRLRDNYLRFYLRTIAPRKDSIIRGATFEPPNWSSMMGLQFENLVLNHRHKLFTILKIPLEDILVDNPYFQNQTKTQSACQIDFLIQTKHQNLIICEIKFSKGPVSKGIIEEVQQKVERIIVPKGFSKRCVLIHVNGVADTVEESGYFSQIVAFSDLLD
ncbi:MAG: AAA family ATPase [Chlamydiia bacterium]|nr:AAA family ATPase [Chlamydiia bacterium]